MTSTPSVQLSNLDIVRRRARNHPTPHDSDFRRELCVIYGPHTKGGADAINAVIDEVWGPPPPKPKPSAAPPRKPPRVDHELGAAYDLIDDLRSEIEELKQQRDRQHQQEQAKRPSVLDDFENVCREHIGVTFCISDPGGLPFASWEGQAERQAIGRDFYQRFRVALMDVPNAERFGRRNNNDLSALVHEACRRHPFEDDLAVSAEWNAIEGVIRAVPPGRYRIEHIIERAGALLRNQTGVVVNRGALGDEARKVARRLGLRARDRTSRYNVPSTGGGWEASRGSEQYRVWETPPHWAEDGAYLRQLAGGK